MKIAGSIGSLRFDLLAGCLAARGQRNSLKSKLIIDSMEKKKGGSYARGIAEGGFSQGNCK